MIDHVAATSLSIENFEKGSGLLILNFGDGNIARCVDCGTWQKDRYGLAGHKPYAARNDLTPRGRMNLRLKPRTDTTTDIRITTRYVLENDSGDVWEFTSDRPATVTVRSGADWTPPQRTCRATQAAEREIIGQIRNMSTSL